MSRLGQRLALLAFLPLLGGCVTLPRVTFTEAEQATATPEGFSDIRYSQDDPQLVALLRRTLRPDDKGQMNVLAISGGGANGAYGAGLLYRWTETADKPEFQLVTGVSTGALTAPFAFLGRDWDGELHYAYSGPKVHHLLRSRGLMSLLTPGIYSKAPLNELVRGYVTDELMQAIAAQHAKGRQLLVATTNLDTERLTIWDMGAIAAHGGPEARALFAEVLIASASVPGVFPPAMIAVKSGAKSFTEMHVDGQTQSAFFAIPGALLTAAPAAPAAAYQLNLYVIINGHVDSLFAVTPRAVMPVLARTFDVANKASIRSVLITTAEYCESHKCVLKVSALPSGVLDNPLDFGVHHIRDLFTAGVAVQDSGQAWTSAAPHYN